MNQPEAAPTDRRKSHVREGTTGDVPFINRIGVLHPSNQNADERQSNPRAPRTCFFQF